MAGALGLYVDAVLEFALFTLEFDELYWVLVL